jgi:hypothetical protein
MTDADDFEEREQRTRAFLTDKVQRAIKLRSKDREFHGLNREFIHHKSQMLADFERSKDVKHIRDVGDAREQILRKFLSDSGYLPARYGSDVSRHDRALIYVPWSQVVLSCRFTIRTAENSSEE